MRPLPENVTAPIAFPESFQPAKSARWHQAPYLWFRNLKQFPATGRAARLPEVKTQCAEGITELLQESHAKWYEESGLHAITNHGEQENL